MQPTPSNSWSFDFYRATVDKSHFPQWSIPDFDPFLPGALGPETVADHGPVGALISQFGDRLELEAPRHAPHGFRVSHRLLLDGQRAGLYMDGHVSGRCLFEFSGAFSQEGATFIRHWFPLHRVTRADVAVLFDFPGAFDQLRRTLNRAAAKGRKRTCPVGNPTDGRTLYLPAKRYSGEYGYTRLYEFGKLHGHDPALVRVEHQTMPFRSDKDSAAAWEPVSFASYTRLQAAVSAALELEVSVPTPKPKPIFYDLPGRMDFIRRTYRRTLIEALEASGGDFSAIGRSLVVGDRESDHQLFFDSDGSRRPN